MATATDLSKFSIHNCQQTSQYIASHSWDIFFSCFLIHSSYYNQWSTFLCGVVYCLSFLLWQRQHLLLNKISLNHCLHSNALPLCLYLCTSVLSLSRQMQQSNHIPIDFASRVWFTSVDMNAFEPLFFDRICENMTVYHTILHEMWLSQCNSYFLLIFCFIFLSVCFPLIFRSLQIFMLYLIFAEKKTSSSNSPNIFNG